MKTIYSRIIFLFCLCITQSAIHSQSVSIDSSFGVNGILTTSANAGSVSSIVVQADGRILAAGALGPPTPVTARYKPSGDVDSTFGVNGYASVTTGIGGAGFLLLQTDGKIQCASSVLDSNNHELISLLRYTSNGIIDSSFGTNGYTLVNPGFTLNNLAAAALQADGKAVLTGYVNSASGGDKFLVIRYRTNGQLDSSFGTNGIVMTKIGAPTEDDQATSIAIQTDGKIVIGGTTVPNSSSFVSAFFALARYNVNGTLDATFGSGGKKVDSTVNGGIKSVGIQSTGKIVAAGFVNTGNGPSDYARVRYNTNGSVDTTFRNVTYGSGSNFNMHRGMIIEGNDKIVLGGSSSSFSTTDIYFSLVRLNPNGGIDSSFHHGYFLSSANNTFSYEQCIAMQPDHRILLGGSDADTGSAKFAIMRYLPGLDTPSFTVCNLQVIDSLTQPNHSSTTGEAQIFVTGGTPPYQYREGIHGIWQSTSTFSNLAPGIDTIYVRDSSGCAETIFATITSTTTGITELSSADIKLYPNPNKGSFTLKTLNSIGNNYTIYDMLETVIAQNTIASDIETIQLPEASGGIYTLIVTGAVPVRFVVVQ